MKMKNISISQKLLKLSNDDRVSTSKKIREFVKIFVYY